MAFPRRLARVGPGLVVVAAAGFLLGSCAGGDGSALTTATGVTATRPEVTATRPGVTATRPATTRTDEVAVTTTAPPETVTTVETQTETETETQTQTETETETETTVETETETESVPVLPATTATTESTPTTAEEDESSSDDMAWLWVALGAALALALLVGLLLWRRSRMRAASWSSGMTDLSRRTLVTLDDVLANGSIVTGKVQALADEARSLEHRAPDDAARASAAPLRGRLDELADTLESDRTLRLGSPPASQEQLSYSSALIRQQVEQLQGVLRPPSPA